MRCGNVLNVHPFVRAASACGRGCTVLLDAEASAWLVANVLCLIMIRPSESAFNAPEALPPLPVAPAPDFVSGELVCSALSALAVPAAAGRVQAMITNAAANLRIAHTAPRRAAGGCIVSVMTSSSSVVCRERIFCPQIAKIECGHFAKVHNNFTRKGDVRILGLV